MKRPWQVWLVFVVCVGCAGGAMAWLTQQALHTDLLRRVAQANADLEQRVSLALWRMDTELAPLVAEEVIRPPTAYHESFVSTANADDPFGQQVATWVPSPLLVHPPEFVLLQFEADPQDNWRSPQVPDREFRELATNYGFAPEVLKEHEDRLAELAKSVELPQLLAMLPSTPLPTAAVVDSNRVASQSATSRPQVDELAQEPQFFAPNQAQAPQQQSINAPQTEQRAQNAPSQQAQSPLVQQPQPSPDADFAQRNFRYQDLAQKGFLKQQREANLSSTKAESTDEVVGISRPLWVDNRLLLVRRVEREGETVIQGAWFDWQQLKERLMAEMAELLPDADLQPVRDPADADPSRMLAGLPVRLVVGPAADLAAASPTLRWALWIGWGALFVAVVAAAALLHGVMTLSERRAAFVSSVTHELRTPLTTFRMYAEMLARGMVPDPQRRQEYFTTLEREAARLTLLVENVLAYARLERGRRPRADDRVALAGLLDRIRPRLEHRAAQADMQCDLQVDESLGPQEITTDPHIVEQILFNLVDNAAKYAATADDRRIHIEANRNGQWVELSVGDHGPGIVQARWPWRIRAFGKSAEESAESAPGVGLGLALCRRLARELGGRLTIVETPGGGATVLLQLPVA